MQDEVHASELIDSRGLERQEHAGEKDIVLGAEESRQAPDQAESRLAVGEVDPP
jgi:hypothetical protein